MTVDIPHSLVEETNDADFRADVLESSVPVLVEFGAPWCPPCRQMAPVIARIAAQRSGALRVMTINNDENPLTALRHHVLGLPTFILFVGGEPVLELRGARPQGALDRALDDALAGPH